MAINVEMPFWKAKQQMAQYDAHLPINLPVPEVDNDPPEPPNVLVDAVSVGGSNDPKQKPLVRHVLVKDLSKIGRRLNLTFPKTGVFSNKAPMGLYALFDGQSCAGTPGPMAADFCARNFYTKLLGRLGALPAMAADRAAVEGALKRSFEELDHELLANQPEVRDGCGAAVALLIGGHVFTAVLGRCSAVLCEVEEGAYRASPALGGRRGDVADDARRVQAAGGTVFGESGRARIRHPLGLESPVSRSLGDRSWKGGGFPNGEGPPIVVCVPEVRSAALRGQEAHPFLLLAAASVAESLGPQELVEIASGFRVQPRAACGEIAARALEAHAGAAALAQCTAVEVCFLPPRAGPEDKKRAPGTAGPEPSPRASAAKKARVGAAPGGETSSVRLRHICLTYSDMRQQLKEAEAKGKKPRSRQEAEAVLRGAMTELRKDLSSAKKPPKDATELVNATSKKFMELCKEHSECETARKGGAMCGDLGWLTPEERTKMGGSFREVVDVLLPGQFSDIAVSDQGVHLVQRTA